MNGLVMLPTRNTVDAAIGSPSASATPAVAVVVTPSRTTRTTAPPRSSATKASNAASRSTLSAVAGGAVGVVASLTVGPTASVAGVNNKAAAPKRTSAVTIAFMVHLASPMAGPIVERTYSTGSRAEARK
jgi:hypothetical protein